MSREISRLSKRVLAGRMRSASRQSFSSQGCWATMVSMDGCCRARMYSLESFQQVIQQGESVQIMWTSEQPGSG